MDFIKNLKWRYATKKFDDSKKVDENHIALLQEAIRLSASSYGLQPYKVIIIEQQKLRERLKTFSWNQPQIVDASHLFVFCSQTKFTDEQIDDYLHLKSNIQGIPLDNLAGYAEFMKGKVREKSSELMKQWTAKQAYLALGNLFAACAELKIDSCPIEGFEPDHYDDILGLKQRGLTATVLMAVGYRSDEDQNQHLTKVRKSNEQIFERIV